MCSFSLFPFFRHTNTHTILHTVYAEYKRPPLCVDMRHSFIVALANVTFCETLVTRSNNSSLSLELSVGGVKVWLSDWRSGIPHHNTIQTVRPSVHDPEIFNEHIGGEMEHTDKDVRSLKSK